MRDIKDISIEMEKLETKNPDDILKEKLEQVFHKKTSEVEFLDIAKIASGHSAIDLAYAASNLPLHARPILYDNLPNTDEKINFIINTTPETRLIIFRYMSEKDVKDLFEKMPADEAVFILDDMSERRFKRVMEIINPIQAKKIQEQKKHKRNTAGRLMISEFFSFDMHKTIKDAKDYIHDRPRIDFTKGIFICDDKGLLKGHVPVRNMVVNSDKNLLKKIMRPILHKVKADASRQEILELFERYKLQFLPVIDDEDKLLGVISHEDVLEAMEDFADETFAKISGTFENLPSEESIFKRFFARSPWLLVTLMAGLVNVGIISSFFEKKGAFFTFLMFFVPLITGMSGNIGIQCSTVLVRRIAFGFISKTSKVKAIFKELLTGITSGLVFGVFCAALVFVIDSYLQSNVLSSPLALATVVGLGLIGACLAGTFLGVFSPVFFAKIGIDPAIAAGPIVTAFNDIVSMSIYFVISYSLTHLFFT